MVDDEDEVVCSLQLLLEQNDELLLWGIPEPCTVSFLVA